MENNIFEIYTFIEGEIEIKGVRDEVGIEIENIITRLIKMGIPPTIGYGFYSNVCGENFTLNEIIVEMNFINYYLSLDE